MKEPKFIIKNGIILPSIESFDGYARMKDELFPLEDNRYGIKYIFQVDDKLLSTRKDPKCSDGGWFYAWEYKPDASVFFVRPGDSDTFDASEVAYHIRVGKLAFGQSDDTPALMTTLSEDAMDILQIIGEIRDGDKLNWQDWPA